jgi:hypothetical protein
MSRRGPDFSALDLWVALPEAPAGEVPVAVAVWMKLSHAATVALGAIYVDKVVPDP